MIAQNVRAHPGSRVFVFDVDGRRYWAKRPEPVGWFRRMQKGDADRSFRREVALLHAFREKGAPVAPIAARIDDAIVMPDMGPALSGLPEVMGKAEFARVLDAAAAALARLHAAGMAHGRPRLRDICWQDPQICFIDLEAGAALNAPRWRQARDLLLLLHSVHQSRHGIGDLASGVLHAYERDDTAEIVPLAKRIARGLRPLAVLVRPLARRHLARGKTNSEVVAFLATLRTMA